VAGSVTAADEVTLNSADQILSEGGTISGISAKLTAVNGIGTGIGGSVVTKVENLKATNTNNIIAIANTDTGDGLSLTNFGSGNAVTNTNGGLALSNSGTINVDSPIVVGGQFGLIAAGGDLNVNASITGHASTGLGFSGLLFSTGDINQAAGTAITVQDGGIGTDPLLIGAGFFGGAGAFVQQAGASIAYGGGEVLVGANGPVAMAGSVTARDLSIESNGGDIQLPSATLSGNLSASSSGGEITQTAAVSVAGTSNIDAGTASITLTKDGNDFQDEVTLTGGDVQVRDANGLKVRLATTGEAYVIANMGGGTGDLVLAGTSGKLTAVSNGGVLEWNSLTVNGNAILIAGTPVIPGATLSSAEVTGPSDTGNVLATTTTYTGLNAATGNGLVDSGLVVNGELVLVASNLPRNSVGEFPSIKANTGVLKITSLNPDDRLQVIIVNGEPLRLLADTGEFHFRAGSTFPGGVSTLDPDVVKVFVGGFSISSTLDELAQRAATSAAQRDAVSSASSDARQSFGTDSVTQQIDMGFSGDVGIAPTMGHNVPLEGEIISTPPCVSEAKGGQQCKE